MTNQRKNLLAMLFVLIVVGAVSVYIFKDLRKSVTNNVQPVDKSNELEPIYLDNQTSRGYKITVLPEEASKSPSASVKMPDLDLAVKNESNLNDAAFKVISQNTAKITKELKDEPNNELNWLNLAVYRKMLGDYAGSVKILDYVTILWPTDYAPFNNLADLYQFYIKNYPLAEKNWLKVVELKPDYIQAYENLHALYKDLYQEKQAQALPILLRGLNANPKGIDLMVFIARYHKNLGDKDNARIYYSKAIQEAKNQNNQNLTVTLEQEANEGI